MADPELGEAPDLMTFDELNMEELLFKDKDTIKADPFFNLWEYSKPKMVPKSRVVQQHDFVLAQETPTKGTINLDPSVLSPYPQREAYKVAALSSCNPQAEPANISAVASYSPQSETARDAALFLSDLQTQAANAPRALPLNGSIPSHSPPATHKCFKGNPPCNIGFPTYDDLFCHFEEAHGVKEDCYECKKRFRSQQEHHKHLISAHGYWIGGGISAPLTEIEQSGKKARGEHRCKHCEADFTSKDKLYTHLETAHKYKYRCQDCDYPSASKKDHWLHFQCEHRYTAPAAIARNAVAASWTRRNLAENAKPAVKTEGDVLAVKHGLEGLLI